MDNFQWEISIWIKGREIGQKLNLNLSSVHYILKKHKLNKTIENLPNIGRPRKLSDREERRLIIKSKQNPFQTANDLQEKTSEGYIQNLTLPSLLLS